MIRRFNAPTDIVVHGAWTRPDQDIGVEEIRAWHLDRGFEDIGYHYVIRRDGTVEIGRSLEFLGAHVKGHNSESVGICLAGGKPKGDVDIDGSWDFNYSEEQLKALTGVIAALILQWPSIQNIKGHRDYPGVTKDCPGFDVQVFYDALLQDAVLG